MGAGMKGYAILEQAVIGQIVTRFPDVLDADRVQGGDIDKVLDAMFQGGGAHGCVLEMGGGREGNGESFERDAWVWTIFGFYFIRYTEMDDIEAQVRDVVARLASLFQDNRRLHDLTPLARVTRIESPEPVQINDIPFYWVTFYMDVIDRG